MRQKEKLLIILGIIAAVVLVVCLYFLIKNLAAPRNNALTPPATNTASNLPPSGGQPAKERIVREISGRVVSVNGLAVYIKLEDGKGFAAYIDPSVPVLTAGAKRAGTLVNLKVGQNVTIKVDQDNKAVQILIKN